jgi:hypothetical protein
MDAVATNVRVRQAESRRVQQGSPYHAWVNNGTETSASPLC